MNDVILIRRVNPNEDLKQVRKVTFNLAGMDKEPRVQEILDILFENKPISLKDVTIKYNGIEILMKLEEIPELVKLFTREGVDIYGVYVVYDN